MKKEWLLIVVVFCLAIVVYTKYFHQSARIEEINTSPRIFYQKIGVVASILPQQKKEKSFRFVLIEDDSRLDLTGYLKKYPEDAVERRDTRTATTLYIFSDNIREEWK